MRIRLASQSDLEGLLALMRRVYHSFGEMPPREEELRAFLVEHLETGDRLRYIVAEQDDDLVGLISLAFCATSLRLSRFAWLDDFHVIERARGRGLGRALLRFACDHARDEGLIEIKLTAASADPRLSRLFRAQNFEASPVNMFILALDRPRGDAA